MYPVMVPLSLNVHPVKMGVPWGGILSGVGGGSGWGGSLGFSSNKSKSEKVDRLPPRALLKSFGSVMVLRLELLSFEKALRLSVESLGGSPLKKYWLPDSVATTE